MLRRLVARITTSVMRRAARMTRRCLPTLREIFDPGGTPAPLQPLSAVAKLHGGLPGTVILPAYLVP